MSADFLPDPPPCTGAQDADSPAGQFDSIGHPIVHGVTWMDRPCPHCGDFMMYSTYSSDPEIIGWDSEFCRRCDIWLISGGGDRPERPSLVPFPEFGEEPLAVPTRRGDVRLLPVRGREGEPGVAWVSLPLGDGGTGLVGVEIRIGSAENPNNFEASRACLRRRHEDVRLSLAVAESPVASAAASAAELRDLRIAPNAEYELTFGGKADRSCRLSFSGSRLYLRRYREQQADDDYIRDNAVSYSEWYKVECTEILGHRSVVVVGDA
jgi:hypothetical protein